MAEITKDYNKLQNIINNIVHEIYMSKNIKNLDEFQDMYYELSEEDEFIQKISSVGYDIEADNDEVGDLFSSACYDIYTQYCDEEECPECGDWSLIDGQCNNCGYSEN